jgi:hypothetical protein
MDGHVYQEFALGLEGEEISEEAVDHLWRASDAQAHQCWEAFQVA